MRVLTRIAIALIVILMSVVSTLTTRHASAQTGCYVAAGVTYNTNEWLIWWAGLPAGWYDQYSIGSRDYVDMRTRRSWRLYSSGARIVGWTQWQFAGTVHDYSLSSGWSPDNGVIVNGYVYVLAPDYATADAVRRQTYLCMLDSSPYTPTPNPTSTSEPTPTPTPTPTSGSGSGGSGSGGSGSGGGGATPPPEWCGFVPQNPCYVEWVSWRTAIAELPTSSGGGGDGGGDVDAQRTAAAALSTMVALPTATPEHAQARRTAEAALTAGPAPVPYAGGEEIANAESDLGVTEVGFVLTRYEFGCPIRYPEWNVEVCIRYVHIQGLRLGPAVISDWVFVGALALVALGFLVRR